MSIISGSVSESEVISQRPSPADFQAFLPWASYQLQAEYSLLITRTVQSKYVSQISKEKKKTKIKPKLKTPSDSGSNAQVTADVEIVPRLLNRLDENTSICIETTYDENDDLVRLKLLNNSNLPRLLFQILALVIPYHKTLSSLIVNKGLHATGIYEISQFYSTNRITEICLDNNTLPEANYDILLDNDIIQHLSLSKCNITDFVVTTIASKLNSKSPASTSLSVLNLSTNRITDDGVKYLAEMLRSNRHLSYLNLADNKITDIGANCIFNILTKFALTSEEIMDRGRNLISYIHEKNELVLKTVQGLQCVEEKKISNKKRFTRPVTTKKKLDEKEVSMDMKPYKEGIDMERIIFERAEVIAEGILGPFNTAFGAENTEKGENVLYCLGNNTLSYLNLAFNNLSYCSVKKLCDVLKTQNILSRKPIGLINVRIEGNYLPESCREFQIIDHLLLSGLSKLKSAESIKKKTSSMSRSNN